MRLNDVIEFIEQLSLILMLLFIYSQFRVFLKKRNKIIQQLVIGVVFALVILLTMLANEQLRGESSVSSFLSIRSVLLSLLGLFWGIIPTLTAVILTVISYFYESDFARSIANVSILVFSCAMGLLLHRYYQGHTNKINWQSFLLLSFLCSLYHFLVAFFTKSPEYTLDPIFLIFFLFILTPCAGIILGYIIIRRLRELDYEQHVLQEQVLQAEFDTTGIGLSILDQTGQRIMMTPSYYQMFGYETAEALQELTWRDLTLPEDMIREDSLFNDLISGTIDEYTIDKQMKCKDGLFRYVRATIINQELEKGTKYLIVTIVDISEQKQEEARVKRLKMQMDTILNLGIIGTHEWDVSNNVNIYNQRFADHMGLPLADLNNNKVSWDNILDHEEYASYYRERDQFYNGEIDYLKFKCHIKSPITGKTRWLKVYARMIEFNSKQQPMRMFSVSYDITEQHEQQEKLEIFASVYESSSEAMIIFDVDFKVISVNRSFSELTGCSEMQALGHSFDIIPLQIDPQPFFSRVLKILKKIGHWDSEITLELKGVGQPEIKFAWMSINTVYKQDALGQETDQVDYHLALFIDITKRKQAEQAIWYQAHYDSLTSLPNRRYFLEQVAQGIDQSSDYKQQLAVLFIDLDSFKQLNDSFGFEQGDLILKTIGQRLKESTRPDDFLAHLSDDEFTLLVTDVKNKAEIEGIAMQLLQLIAQPITVMMPAITNKVSSVVVNASIGIACYPKDADNVDDLLKNSDQAMYVAKTYGRNGYQFFTATMQQQTQDRVTLFYQLQEALKNKEFELYFQPISPTSSLDVGLIDKTSDHVYINAEVLLRWNHPILGVVSPDCFLSIAEESGLIYELGEWVFTQVADQLITWNKMGYKVRLGLNQSPMQFKNKYFNIEQWMDYLKKIGLPPEQLIIEVLEDVLLDGADSTIEQLQCYRQAGVKIALDNFGTGYSSLSHLKRFVVDYIKIDQIFLQNLAENSQDLALCQTIISLAHKMNIQTIAVGVKTKEQCLLLAQLKCDFIQGFYHEDFLNLNDFESYLAEMSS